MAGATARGRQPPQGKATSPHSAELYERCCEDNRVYRAQTGRQESRGFRVGSRQGPGMENPTWPFHHLLGSGVELPISSQPATLVMLSQLEPRKERGQ